MGYIEDLRKLIGHKRIVLNGSLVIIENKDGKTKVIEIVKEIKNTKSPSGSTPTGNSPKTGDSTNIWLPILLAVLSACGIGGVIWYKKKKGN